MQLQVGEQRLIVCGVLKRVEPYEVEGSSGYSGQVDFMGGWTKFTADAACYQALKEHVGKTVQLTGIPKVAGDRGQRGELKLGTVIEATVNGDRVYGRSEGPAASVDPAAVASAKRKFL